ncbi:MAG: VWA domain-containing protein [Candidatus Woesearchaeota archaeon]|jgi:Mg-chelatase subunit ChlD
MDKEYGSVPSVPEKAASEELSGKMRKDNRSDKLMHSQVEVDKDKIDKARVLSDAINNNMSSFSPDLSFEQFVNNFSSAKKLYGETLVRELTGYDSNYVDKNMKVPEFKRELKERMKQNIERLKQEGFLDKEGFITDMGYNFAALSMLSEELEKMEGHGFFGENISKQKSVSGDIKDYRSFKSGDSYRGISLKQTIKKAVRRGRAAIEREDLVSTERNSKGKMEIVYALDTSGSMKGDKIGVAKKAGVALMYRAISNNDCVGLIVFGSKVQKAIAPTRNFSLLLSELTRIKTSGETDIVGCIDAAIKLFSMRTKTKHLVLITDAMQTLGKKPEEEVLESISQAANSGVTITVVGISLNKEGERLAKKIVNISEGSLYEVKSLDNLDQVVIEDYYKVRSRNSTL